MKQSLQVLAALLFAFTVAPATAQLGPAAPIAEKSGFPEGPPIAAVGHGTMFAPDGSIIKPTRAFTSFAVEYYLKQIKETSPYDLTTKMALIEKELASRTAKTPFDRTIHRSIVLDWLIQEVRPENADHISAINTTLRRSYFTDVLGLDPREYRLHYNSGIPLQYLKLLGDFGIVAYAITDAGGEKYVQECRDAGVPTPPTWKPENGPSDKNRGNWTFEGTQTLNFASSAPVSEVYAYDTAGVSSEPDGLCIALPRISGSTIDLLGIICLGRETGKACFWDRAGTGLNEEVPISGFKGGADLANGDVCSDCHAGESPYVVHPGTAVDLGSAQDSPVWYEPLVKASWPQNPGPTALLNYLPLGPGEGDCRGCHKQFDAGRLPEVGALPQYCSTVLSNAVVQTMPIGSPGDPAYAKHINALKAFCSQDPPDGTTVPVDRPDEDRGFISPPIVIGPVYACATAVEVRGLIYGAKLTIFIDGAQVAQVQVTQPSQQIVAVPALVVGQEVVAVQEKNGVVSAPSTPVKVHDHRDDYPAGLPEPEIDPALIHECGRTIAVRHIRGAQVTVFTNGGDPAKYSSGGDWTNMPPAIRPFNLSDVYTARQSICSDDSPLSSPETAVAPPAPMPNPTLDPPAVYAGQELVHISNLAHGALTRVEVGGTGAATLFATAVSWNPEVDIATPHGGPLSAGQNLVVTSELCNKVEVKFPDAERCDGIPAPVIAPPFVGNSHVNVLDAIPGARILVFDAGGAEIGDGSGVIVVLNRAIVAGDVLTVVQKVGDCISTNGYRVTALCTTPDQGCG